VIVSVPSVTPVTSPLALTEATADALETQVTSRPVSTFPLASLRVATSCSVRPMSNQGLGATTLTDATGAVDAEVTPVVTFDRSPNTALPPSFPRKATS